ncbi:MAG TPA: signal peptidase I [Thermoanaerobaculia bacterium]|nr:signal peptidase I [Thermoanaerobaculia bacterium]
MAAAAESETKSTYREYFEALLIAIIFVNFARIFVFQAFKIPSPSMEDNLKVGDHLIVNKFIYGPKGDHLLSGLFPLRDVERGDTIVFRFPENPEIDYVKRVVGLPGDVVTIRDKKVSINGRPLDEPYTLFIDPQTFPGGDMQPEPYRSRDQFGPFRVPEGQYFAMGDNRDRSADSRYWGGVPRSHVKGRAFMVYWSFDGQGARDASVRERVRELRDVVAGFFTRTRWHRTFFIVDSKYHYTPGTGPHGTD